ncbi:MAG: NUDIX hydrolase [Pseudomonadota bacterium]
MTHDQRRTDWSKVRMGERQVSALPLRRTKSDELRVLLITSRDTGRWIIPKGWPVKGCSDWDTAQVEAREEAGVEGSIHRRPIGSYDYSKRLDNGKSVECSVRVYPLAVERELAVWKEKDQRKRKWFTKEEACRKLSDAGLARVLSKLETF